jgi:hypothetical protein
VRALPFVRPSRLLQEEVEVKDRWDAWDGDASRPSGPHAWQRAFEADVRWPNNDVVIFIATTCHCSRRGGSNTATRDYKRLSWGHELRNSGLRLKSRKADSHNESPRFRWDIVGAKVDIKLVLGAADEWCDVEGAVDWAFTKGLGCADAATMHAHRVDFGNGSSGEVHAVLGWSATGICNRQADELQLHAWAWGIFGGDEVAHVVVGQEYRRCEWVAAAHWI